MKQVNGRQSEYRAVKFTAEMREAENGQQKMILRGYPILFNTPTKVYDFWYGEVTETILPTALDGVNLDEVCLLVGHNANMILGRNRVNMRLEIDETGLFMECELPATQCARDTYVLVEMGIMDGMSFGFNSEDRVNPETLTRTITHFSEVYEVTITPFPAYKETVVMATDGKTDDKKPVTPQEKLAEEIQNTINSWEE